MFARRVEEADAEAEVDGGDCLPPVVSPEGKGTIDGSETEIGMVVSFLEKPKRNNCARGFVCEYKRTEDSSCTPVCQRKD